MEGSRSGAVRLLRDPPSRPTQRACKLSSDLEKASLELDQGCFEGGAEEQQAAFTAFQHTWQDIKATIKELQQHAVAGVLEQLQQWAAATAAPPAAQPLPKHQQQQQQAPAFPPPPVAGGLADPLPVVMLSVASSTNTAETYADVLLALRKAGHPTALVSTREAGNGLAAVVNSAMRQFLAMPGTAADDMPALLAWWQDEHQRCYGARGAGTAATPCRGSAPGSSKQRGAAATPAAAAAAAAAAGGASDGMQVDGCPAQTPPPPAPSAASRALRSRTPLSAIAAAAAAAAGGRCAAPAQLQAPVLIVQDTDAGDAEALQELVVALHEARKVGLPLVLVLGINSSQAGVLALLANAVLRRVQLLQLSLPPARQQLARFFRTVLLRGPQPRLVLGPSCAAWLLSHFRDIDCSASMAQRAVQLACVEHFHRQPLACLSAAAASGSHRKLRAAVAGLRPAQLARCCRALLAAAEPHLLPQQQQQQQGLPDATGAQAGADDALGGAAQAQAAAVGHLRALLDGSRGQRRGGGGGGGSKASPPAASRDAAAAAAAAGVLEGATWAAAGAFQRWRLGVLALRLLASFTGAGERDASFQLPALFAAASQPSFLTAPRRGMQSPCARLLHKLLAAAGASGTADSGKAGTGAAKGMVPVEALQDGECVQLLDKLLQLLRPALCAAAGHTRRRRSGRAAGNSEGGSSSSDDGGDEGGSSSSSDGGESDALQDSSGASSSDSEGDSPRQRMDPSSTQRAAAAAAAASWTGAQELLRACEALHAAAAVQLDGVPTAPGSTSSSSSTGGVAAALADFPSTFSSLLAPLPELLSAPTEQQQQQQQQQRAAAAAAMAGELGGSVSAAALGLCSTPAGRAAGGSAAGAGSGGSTRTPVLTPGGLASQLRRRVCFAPDTPDHGALKAGGPPQGSSSRSTPQEGAGGLAALSKTPNKRTPGAKGKPRKKLFDPKAAAAAAAAAAADGSKRKPRRKEKQQAEVGEIAGSSAAALAAVAAAAGGDHGAAGGAAASAVKSNKRHARLFGMMAASGGGGAAAPGAAAAGGAADAALAASGSSEAPAAQARGRGAGGLLLSPAPRAGSDLVPSPLVSPSAAPKRPSRLQRGSNATNPPAREPASADGDADMAGTSPAALEDDGGARLPASARSGTRGSRVAQRRRARAPAASDGAAAGAEDAAAAVMMDVDGGAAAAAAGQALEQAQPQVAAAGAPAAARTCGALLAQLLRAVVPKLLLDWSCPTSPHNSCLAAAAAADGSGGQAAGQKGAVAAAPAALGASLAAAGAAAFTFDSAALFESHLAAAAPAAVHTALVAPHLRLQGHPVGASPLPGSLQQQPGWEDTCLAYVLLQQQRDEGLPVSDWFGLFCEAVGVQGYARHPGRDASAEAQQWRGGDEAAAAAAAAAGGRRGDGAVGSNRAAKARARAGRKARGYAEARDAAAGAAADGPSTAAGGDGGSSKAPGRRSTRQQQQQHEQDQGGQPSAGGGMDAPPSSRKRRGARQHDGGDDGDDGAASDAGLQPAEVDQQQLLAAAARFSQAAAELQLLGVWKGTKRRRAAAVLRVFAPEGPDLPTMAAAAAVAGSPGAAAGDV